MRRARVALGAALLLAAALLCAGACDSTQPLRGGEQVLVMRVVGTAPVRLVDVWDWWIDENSDGQPDRLIGVRCMDVTGSPTPPTRTALVPWHYVAELALVAAGSTQESIIASTVDTQEEFFNRTPYDTAVLQTLPDFSDNTGFFRNGRRVTRGHRDYIEGCLELEPIPANLFGSPDGVQLGIEPGDTVIFRLRKQVRAASDFGGNTGNPPEPIFAQLPSLALEAFLGGAPVSPTAGEDSTDESDGSGFTFVFTLQ